MNKKEPSLHVNEIFVSIQGESTHAGIPCIFVRLTGCNLRCSYCDAVYAYSEGSVMSLEEILDRVRGYETRNVCITGGEPLLQENISKLINLLKKAHFNVYIETNGSRNIDILPKGIVRIVDIKCPDSGMEQEMDWQNIERLKSRDEVKFIISSKRDYEWAKWVTVKYNIRDRATVLFGLVHGKLKPKTLAGWILIDGLDVRLQLQLHKIIWADKTRGV
ncbi:MAG: radical SAM protein [Candidatus Scalindua sp.]|jgi:7-carboxy-7-deazaguanine synthase|nr:radical SAM protein [Candidatus Scalindua sp.]MDV5165744.1 radical SAM protein [Candidatus Scalindua sp.]